VRDRLNLEPKQVATVGSWAHFNAIAEHTEGKTFVNAGQEPLSVRGISFSTRCRPDVDFVGQMRHDAFAGGDRPAPTGRVT
jgi:hypothetical protein